MTLNKKARIARKNMNWYALFVKSNSELYVQQWLRFYFDESTLRSIVPKRKLVEKKGGLVYHSFKTLFPGYVLINTEMNESIYHKIKSIPKLIGILKDGSHYSKIEKDEIEPILKLIDNNEIIDYSTLYVENTSVIVKGGPLKDMEGTILKIDKRKKRAKILLTFLNSQKIFDVGIDILNRT